MLDRPQRKRAVNLSLDAALVEEAKALGVNLSAAAEAGLREAAREAWRRENAEAIARANEWVEKNGLPLARFRQF
ncbi:MAG: type II toxin-antitoxin system CcdA family antitoxin [Pikeienuella sp.]|uniref:type II toxin-antitoxin system CcdA family antitoxin n=1 Tax=Pikeienuella sp. TaxID=2831957 RepID=UPI0039198E3F